MNQLEQTAELIGTGQRLEELLQHRAWGDVQQILSGIYEAAVKEALDPSVTETQQRLSRLDRAAAIKGLIDTLKMRIDEAITYSRQLRTNVSQQPHTYF
jgi:hypothetical protein